MSLPRTVTVEIGEDPPARLDSALARFLPADESISRTRLKGLILGGHVRIGEDRVTDPTRMVKPGESWTITVPEPDSAGLAAEKIDLSILHEDDEVLVLDKPAGMVVHPARGNWQGTLINAVLHHCGDGLLGIGDVRRPGIVHRLDKDTSGVMVVAKTDRAVDSLSRQFGNRTVGRIYLAVIRGVPDNRSRFAGYDRITVERGRQLRIEGDIGRHPGNRLKMAVVKSGGRAAVTRVKIREVLASGAASLVECRLETGRTHQIRVHLDRVGHPVIGDQLYGSGSRTLAAGQAARDAASGFGRQALHAALLEFDHPAHGQRRRFEAGMPDDMTGLVDALKSDPP